MTREAYILTVTMLVIVSFFTCALPIMSVFSGGLETCTIFARGYNFIEFSPWGVLAVLSPIIASMIAVIYQSRFVKVIEYIALMLGSIIGYSISFCETHKWLKSIGDASVELHSGAVLMPLTLFMMILLCMGMELKFLKHRNIV